MMQTSSSAANVRENAEDEVTITVIATGLDAHGANTPVERAMKDFTNYKTKVPAQQAPIQRTAPTVKVPSEAAATTESAPKYNIPTGNAPVYRPAQRGETQINIPDFLRTADKILRMDKLLKNSKDEHMRTQGEKSSRVFLVS